jgi:Ca-activated chloride channel family protein
LGLGSVIPGSTGSYVAFAPSGKETEANAGSQKNALKASTRDDLGDLNARQAVRQGNERLNGGRPAEALEAYMHAKQLEPEAREIAFVEGLAHYDLAEFDRAREAFRDAAGLAGDALADDAFYSLGATDHREALETMEGNPKLALSLLENAMHRYHDVLGRRPDHQPARDANFKAASMWRELKQRLEQQQQQQSDQDQEGDDQDNKQADRDQQQQQQDDSEKQQESQQSEPQDQDEQQQEDEQQQQSQAKEHEQVSREQAERRLREMMQAIRDRKKMRRQRVPKIPVAPVDKDW